MLGVARIKVSRDCGQWKSRRVKHTNAEYSTENAETLVTRKRGERKIHGEKDTKYNKEMQVHGERQTHQVHVRFNWIEFKDTPSQRKVQRNLYTSTCREQRINTNRKTDARLR